MSTFFDDDFPSGERIPRHLDVTLWAQPGPYGDVVRMIVNGFPVGDPLTDTRSAARYTLVNLCFARIGSFVHRGGIPLARQ